MTTDPPRLAVHVFGAAKGESIVLELPGGRWGVVDCYAASLTDPGSNPTLRFLRERGVADLEFLALTHPHDDHYRGMSQLLEAFPVRWFWRFNGLSGPHLEQFATLLRAEAEADGWMPSIEDSTEFQRIFRLVQERRRRQEPPLRQKRSGPAVPLYPVPDAPDATIRIFGLAPSADQVARYEHALIRYLDASNSGRPLPQPEHNTISAAFLVRFGQTRIVLGGDVESGGWRDAIAEVGPAELAADAVKLSHHGSTNGYCAGLWGIFSSRVRPIGIVTAYAAQGLPRRAALDHIRPHLNSLLTTCVTALKDEQFPAGSDPEVLRSRLALHRKMGRLVDESRHACGRCTLVFDDRGGLVARELAPPADEIPPGTRVEV